MKFLHSSEYEFLEKHFKLPEDLLTKDLQSQKDHFSKINKMFKSSEKQKILKLIQKKQRKKDFQSKMIKAKITKKNTIQKQIEISKQKNEKPFQIVSLPKNFINQKWTDFSNDIDLDSFDSKKMDILIDFQLENEENIKNFQKFVLENFPVKKTAKIERSTEKSFVNSISSNYGGDLIYFNNPNSDKIFAFNVKTNTGKISKWFSIVFDLNYS